PVAPKLLHADAGTELQWADQDTDHQITIVRGTCSVLGRRLTPGSYAYIPAGMPHSLKAGAWGCTFFSVPTSTTAA
ncbi:MAG: hypothetical protein ACREMG_07430, partial [Gemmatimonadales bacterium]